MRFFNTSGPVVPADHYCIPPLERVDLDDIRQLVRNKRYFVLHAPRQTGKTSVLLALRDLLNAPGGLGGEGVLPEGAGGGCRGDGVGDVMLRRHATTAIGLCPGRACADTAGSGVRNGVR